MDNEDSDSDCTQSNPISSTALLSTNRYNGGRIMRIKLTNFMVYDDVEMFPGPGLNLIIGPNGSGKSTTVCGICLGLAGKPSFTGRKMHVAEFIKHGKNEATIEIELDDPKKGRNIVIRRNITSTGNSQYAINNRRVREVAVEKELARFNIQINNLCQFLPQEKVSEFCKMNAVELLESMQQAVGDEDLFKSHNELKNLHNGSRELESEIASAENDLASEKEKNERIETEVQIYVEIQTLNKRKTLLKEIIQLLKYKDIRLQMVAQKVKRQKLIAKEKNFQQYLDPIRNEQEMCKNSIAEYNKELREKTKSFGSHKKNMAYLLDQISTIENKIYDAYADLDLKIQGQKGNEERMKVIQSQLENHMAEHHLAEQQITNLEKQQGSISAEIERIRVLNASTEVAIDDLGYLIKKSISKKRDYENELLKLSGIDQRKLEVLKNCDVDTFQAVMWLRENRYLFKKQIFDPILMMVEVPSPDNIKYVENHIGFRDLIAFVCEDKEDSRLLVEKLRNEKGWAINIVLAPSKKPSDFQPKVSIHELRNRFSFSCYLKDIFVAPDPIISFLCATYHIQNTPVGDENTKHHLDEIIDSNNFLRFYITDSSYIAKRSRYGSRNISMANSVLKTPRILSAFTNTTERQMEIEKKLRKIGIYIQTREKKLQDLDTKYKRNRELEVLRRKENAYADAKNARKGIELLISQKKKSLEAIRKLCSAVTTLMKATEDFVADKKKERLDKLEEIKRILIICYKLKERIMQLHFYVFAISRKENIIARNLIEEEESHKNLAVYDEYQQRKKEILKSEAGLKKAKMKLEAMKSEMQRKKEGWLTPLNDLISKISKTFSKYFEILGCAGELGLKMMSDNPDDFDKYGLSVRVKFRDASPLQELSDAYHSGGECSVSTIIFILALQKLTEVPFRCVDEINQGMDSINERRIFELVAMNSEKSQYFLLTPKLQPDLTYPKEMKVHIIKNAPLLHEDIDWQISSIINNVKHSLRND